MRLKRTGRGGRPSASQKGDVDARILEASTRLFLANGFGGTTLDRVAELARAGKASIYSRYQDKEALFLAVVRRNVELTMERTTKVAAQRPVRERLGAVGLSILEETLVPDCIALMRMVIAEAGRLPTLAADANAIGFELSVHRVAEVVAARDPSEDSIVRAGSVASRFVELVFLPILMHALMGGNSVALMKEAPRRIEEAIAFIEPSLSRAGWD